MTNRRFSRGEPPALQQADVCAATGVSFKTDPISVIFCCPTASQRCETHLQPKQTWAAANLQLPDMRCLKIRKKKKNFEPNKHRVLSFLNSFAAVVFDFEHEGAEFTRSRVVCVECWGLGIPSRERVKPPRMQELCCVWWRQTFIRPFTTSSWNPSTSCKSKNHKYSSPYISTRSWEHGMLQNALNPVIVSCNNTFFTFELGSYQGERT